MGRMKDTIPENYSCNHYLDVNDCMDCQFSMQTSHLKEEYTPSIKSWYNKKTKTKRRRY